MEEWLGLVSRENRAKGHGQLSQGIEYGEIFDIRMSGQDVVASGVACSSSEEPVGPPLNP